MATGTAQEPDLSPATVERLAGLGRLWGAVKFFHPALAGRDVDWDQALVTAAPLVVTAASAADYRRALDQLLAALADPATRTLPPPDRAIAEAVARDDAAGRAGPAHGPPQPHLELRQDGIAVVAATDPTQFVPSERDPVAAFRAAFEAAAEARAIVVDLRGLDGEDPWWAEQALLGALPVLLTEPLVTAGSRHRMHAGHRQQRGPVHGGYYSALVHRPGDVVAPRGRGRRRPLAFLVTAVSPGFYGVLSGLQAAGLAVVVREGEPADAAGTDWYDLRLPDGVTARVRLTDLVAPDGTIGFRPDAVVPRRGEPGWTPERAVDAALGGIAEARPPRAASSPPPPAAPYEQDYPELTAPPPAWRLLALFRFWNAIHYLFPYKPLVDGGWDAVLPEFVPAFAREGDALDYVLTVARLVARTHDSHGFVTGDIARAYWGTHRPPLVVRAVAGETAVTHVDVGAGGIAVGDVVIAVDGEAASARRDRLGGLLAVSTPQALRRRVDELLLAGPEDSSVVLTLRDRAGVEQEVALRRTVPGDAPEPARSLPVFGVLPEGPGYVDLARLTLPQVDAAFAAVWDTAGLIFDMRGYPHGTAWAIAPRLTEAEVVTARFAVPEVHSPDLAAAATIRFHQTAEPDPKGRYRGTVVVLINEAAVSQAEHTCLFLEAAAGATFVGSPTDGTNGELTNLVLPGGVLVGFTGMEVRHADGRQLQRVGIQPHVHVEPTLAGIRAGRDEVLEAAVSLLGDASGGPAGAPP